MALYLGSEVRNGRGASSLKLGVVPDKRKRRSGAHNHRITLLAEMTTPSPLHTTSCGYGSRIGARYKARLSGTTSGGDANGAATHSTVALLHCVEAPGQNALLRVQAVFGLVEHDRLRAIDHLVGDLLAAMGGQAVHEQRVGLG